MAEIDLKFMNATPELVRAMGSTYNKDLNKRSTEIANKKIYISSFNVSRDLSDIMNSFEDGKATNLDFLFGDFGIGKTRWTVAKDTHPGDIVIFMCAKEARHNLGMATSHIPSDYSDEFCQFVDNQKEKYKKYSGHILGYGIVASLPEENDGWWMSDITDMCQFDIPIYIDEYRDFISVSRTGSITMIDDDQWEQLKWVINQKNPGVFKDINLPDLTTLENEFEEAVKKAYLESEDDLRNAAEKRNSKSTVRTVNTKEYHRDPIIAAYVKKRAKGHCQLCGEKAPFFDQAGLPYLECHHIDWLSKGGTDSINNCVALCPNCHRKMHVINDSNDIAFLKKACIEY